MRLHGIVQRLPLLPLGVQQLGYQRLRKTRPVHVMLVSKERDKRYPKKRINIDPVRPRPASLSPIVKN